MPQRLTASACAVAMSWSAAGTGMGGGSESARATVGASARTRSTQSTGFRVQLAMTGVPVVGPARRAAEGLGRMFERGGLGRRAQSKERERALGDQLRTLFGQEMAAAGDHLGDEIVAVALGALQQDRR